jgi:hypothetical protein
MPGLRLCEIRSDGRPRTAAASALVLHSHPVRGRRHKIQKRHCQKLEYRPRMPRHDRCRSGAFGGKGSDVFPLESLVMMDDKETATRHRQDHDLMTEELAVHGWMVEAVLATGRQTEAVFFAVSANTASEAESAVLRYPGILPSDAITARRVLLAAEISRLELRPGGVRPYGRATY